MGTLFVEDSDDILKVKAEPPEENGSTQLFARGGNQARGALTKPGCRRRLEQLIFLPQNFGPGEIFQRVKRIFFRDSFTLPSARSYVVFPSAEGEDSYCDPTAKGE